MLTTFRFVLSGAISNSESLFRYQPRKGPADFRHDDFVPIFLDEASPQDRTKAEKVCGKANLACIYDFIATGSQTVAQATKKTKDTADETETKISEYSYVLLCANTCEAFCCFE